MTGMMDSPESAPDEQFTAPPVDVDLKDRWLALLLAWLMPGLGHLYQGRTGKGLLFMICILGTFIFGLYLGEGKVVYASIPGESPHRWHYYCQLGVGLPALPALVQRERLKSGKDPLWPGIMTPPRPPSVYLPQPSRDAAGNLVDHPDELAQWNYELHDRFELGTVYTVIAGLLNVLAMLDAHAGPLWIVPTPTEKKRRKKKTRAGPPAKGEP